MKSLFNVTTQRHLALLEILYYDKRWCPIKELSEQLDCSESIIRKDIEQINVQFTPFKIVHQPKKGLLLDVPIDMTVEYLYEIALGTSLEFTLLETLFFNPKLTALVLSEELFISQSTLSRLITRCNKSLRSWHIHISNSPHEITGNEVQIRNFFTHFFKEKYSQITSPLSTELTLEFQHLLLSKTKPLGISLKFSEIEVITFMFLTISNRVKLGEMVNFKTDAVKNHPWLHLFLANATFNQLFKDEFNIKWDELVIEQVFFPFLSGNYFFSLEDFLLAAQHSQDIQLRLASIKQLLQDISDQVAIPLTNGDEIILNLYNYHLFFIGNNHLLFDKHKQFIMTFTEEYPQPINTIKKILDDFKFYEGFEWSDVTLNETIYLLITNWEDFLPTVHKQLPLISILISCTFDAQHALLIKDLLEVRLTNNTAITISSALTIPEHLAELADYDLILTNTDKLETDHPHVLCIHPMPNFRDWVKIHTALLGPLETKT